jgi:hypothetical protein
MDLDYFCYISHGKVDSLYEQLDPKAYYEISESKSKTVDVSVSAHANWGIGHIISLFKVGGTYGRKGVMQYDTKIKQGYIEKLRSVLAALVDESAILPLDDSNDLQAMPTRYYHYTGQFQVESPIEDGKLNNDRVVTLISRVGVRVLLLDASLRYFSEGPLPDGTFSVTSSNYRFFTGDTRLTMTCVLVLLEVTPDRLVGSPLFLKLSYGKDGQFVTL